MNIFQKHLMLLVLLIINNISIAQVKSTSELYKTIKKMDTLLFENGFNNCDLKIVKTIVHDDLEFYHDKGGIQNKQEFLNAFKDNLCSTPDKKPIRKLVEESFEVFPMKNNGSLYGVMQTGVHEFYIKEPNKELYITNIAKYSHLWMLEKNQWKLTRSISYNHIDPRPNNGSNIVDKKFDANYPKPLFDNENDINLMLKKNKIPSLGIGYINNGQLQQIRLFGNNKPKISVKHDSIYKIASLTKPITALITLKLINMKQWDLDTPIYKYYTDPDLINNADLKLLTTRHILSHQSGFPNWRYLNNSKKLYFDFKPGDKFQYSGEGFEYLRKSLESKFNKPLDVLAHELIFEPLDMQNTHFYWSTKLTDEQYAQEHDENGIPIDFTKYKQANAAANLMTTIEDYGKFMVHILNGAGLTDELFKQMISKQIEVKPGIDFGLGWKIFNNLGDGEFALQHTGGDYGTKAIAFLLPKSKRGLIIFTNSENGMVLWKKIIEEYFQEIGKKLVDKNINQ